eukprot:gnl/TRDRNA2_/TRDRNA2_85907_c0_seq1.p1 gnl/TRDRNA2_/TRDRNA2_85907_c0~~gnl/TRDRNA2_/TRDRNA2_85907_c0_seq1.p1  ORF type:complete len:566 (-),score=58.07 gnl/TRDRNA2_/TRDRNA2_85907_c0_seq1:24-1661(-)
MIVFGELLLFGLLTLLLVVIWANGWDKYKRNICDRPEGHMPSFDFFRLFFCVGVLLLHCMIIPNHFSSMRSFHELLYGVWGDLTVLSPIADPTWLELVEHKAFGPIVRFGTLAVDGFFLMSGFFTTTGLLRQLVQGQDVNIRAAITSRYLRLFPLVCVPFLWGMLRHDGSLYNGVGAFSGMNWPNVAGWLLFYGNLTGPDRISSWIGNASLAPLWSAVADFHASILLILIVPFLYKKFGFHMSYVLGVCCVLVVMIRYHVQMRDKYCLNGLVANAFELGYSPNFREQIKHEFLYTLIDVPMPYLGDRTCPKMMSEAAADFAALVYFPSWARCYTFLMGAIMACNRCWVKERRSEWASESASLKSMKFWSGRALLFVSFLLFLYPIFPSLRGQKFMSFEALGAFQVMTPPIFDVSTAYIIYTTIVPEDHPFHASWLKSFTSMRCFYVWGSLSIWIYALQWPVLWEVMRVKLLECSIKSGFVYLLIVSIIVIPFAILGLKYFEPACGHTRKVYFSPRPLTEDVGIHPGANEVAQKQDEILRVREVTA